jgi:hypothetical protein
MRRLHTVFLIGLLVPSSATAQSVSTVLPANVELVPAGAPVSVTLIGSGLDDLTGATLQREGAPAQGVTAVLQSGSAVSRSVMLQALSTATPGGYTLCLTSRRLARPVCPRVTIGVAGESDGAIYLETLSLAHDQQYVGGSTTGTFTLSASPSAPLTVQVTSTHTGFVVPAQVTVPAGVTQWSFQVQMPTTLTTPVETHIRVSRPPYNTGPTDSIAAYPAPVIDSLMPNQVVSGSTAILRVSLRYETVQPVTLELASSNPVILVPATVSVPQGVDLVTVPVTVQAHTQTVTSQVTARIAQNELAKQVVVVPPAAISATSLSSTAVVGGADVTLTIHLTTPAPAGGLQLEFQSNQPSAMQTPGPLTVPAGESQASVVIHTLPVLQSTTFMISIETPSISSAAVQLTVNPPSPTLTLPSTAVVGDTVVAQVSLNGTVAAGGSYVMTVESNDAQLAVVPATVTISSGGYQATFAVVVQRLVFTPLTRSVTIRVISPTGVQSQRTIAVARHGLLSGLQLPDTIGVGTSANGTISLDRPAGPQGLQVALNTSSNALALPSSVVVPAGQTSATFIASAAFGLTSSQTVTAQAIDTTQVTRTESVTVKAVVPPVLTQIQATPGEVQGGQTLMLKAVLDKPANPGTPAIVNLSSNHPSVQVPASLTIAAGQSQGTISIVTSTMTQDASATITAVSGNSIRTVSIPVRSPAVLQSLQASPDSVLSGSPASLQITLSHGLAGNTVILSSSSIYLMTLPSTVTVPAGQSSVNVPVTAGQGAGLVTLTATMNGVSRQDTLRVIFPQVVPSSLTAGVASVGPNTQVPFTLTLKGQAPTGGALVQLSSSHPSLVSMPASVALSAGQTSTTFNVTTLAPASTTTVTITATYNFRTASGTITITP